VGEVAEGNKIVKFKEDAEKVLVEQLEKDPRKNKRAESKTTNKQPSPKKKEQEVPKKKAP
jgi:hypothetical protein